MDSKESRLDHQIAKPSIRQKLQPVIDIGTAIAQVISKKCGLIILAAARRATTSKSSRFSADVQNTRTKLMTQLSPIVDKLRTSGGVTYHSSTPSLLDSLDKTSKETIEREVLFRSLGEIHGILDGTVLIESLKINVISIGAEYDNTKSARVTFEITFKNRMPFISSTEHIITLSANS